MNTTVAQLTLQSLLGRRRALLLLVLPAILLALAVAVRALAGVDDEIAGEILSDLALGTMIPLLGVIVGTGAIGPEIDDGSIVYLLAKPLSRRSIAVTKFVSAAGVVAVVGAVPTLLAGFVLSGAGRGVALAFGVGAAIAGLGYCALFLLLAVVTRNAVVVGLVYALIWESLIGGFVPGAQALSIRQWSLAVTERILGANAMALDVDAAVSLAAAVPLLLLVVVGGTWYAGWRLRSLRLADEG